LVTLGCYSKDRDAILPLILINLRCCRHIPGNHWDLMKIKRQVA